MTRTLRFSRQTPAPARVAHSHWLVLPESAVQIPTQRREARVLAALLLAGAAWALAAPGPVLANPAGASPNPVPSSPAPAADPGPAAATIERSRHKPVAAPRYSASDAKLAFGFLDANHDGRISREEAARAKNVVKYFDRADVNQDKGLSLEEFTAALNKAKVI